MAKVGYHLGILVGCSKSVPDLFEAPRVESSLRMRQGEGAIMPTITDGISSVGIGCPLSGRKTVS